MYWLTVRCSMSDSVLAAKKTALSKRGLLSDIGCFVSRERKKEMNLFFVQSDHRFTATGLTLKDVIDGS